MKYRKLGKTGLEVSEIGLGCNRIGDPSMSDGSWVSLVHRAIDQGVNIFDTSEIYNDTRSEEILGKALQFRDDIYVATKVAGKTASGEKDFSPKTIRRSVEDSLRRLRRECIDLYQLHGIRKEHMEQSDEWHGCMKELVKEGKIRFIGASVDPVEDGVALIKNRLVDTIQVTYNVLYPEAGDELLPIARRRHIGVLVKMPYQRGVLTGKFTPTSVVPDGHRALLDNERMKENIRRAEALRPIGVRRDRGMTGLAIQYCLNPPAVSCVIPGARTLMQLESNVRASDLLPLSKEALKEIRRIQDTWKEEQQSA